MRGAGRSALRRVLSFLTGLAFLGGVLLLAIRAYTAWVTLD